jgi:large repetitive protein
MRFGFVLFSAALLSAQAQPSAQPACQIEGTVLNSVTSEPVVRAWVRLRAGLAASATTTSMTDGQGRFVFSGLPAGRYSLQAQRDNFLYEPSATALTLEEREVKAGVVLRLTPLAAIAGRVRTEEGDALPGVGVAALTYVDGPGGRRLATGGSATTNDLGEYRLFGLVPGLYVIRTSKRDGTMLEHVYQATYYSGVLDASGASVLELKAGRELTGIDLALRRSRAASLRGRIVKPPNAVAVKVGVTLDRTYVSDADLDEQGKFEVRGLAPGSYILTASAKAGEKAYIAERTVLIGSDDVQGIVLQLLPPTDVNGSIRMEGSTTVRPPQLSIEMRAPLPAAIKSDGAFVIRDVAPVVQRPVVRTPRGVFLKSIRCGNNDVTESDVDLAAGGCDLVVTLSANVGEIQGNVQEANGKLVVGGAVTLVPQARTRTDLFQSTTSDTNGHFAFLSVAPGTYRIYAWEMVDLNVIRYNQDFTRAFEALGQGLEIVEGGREAVTLKQISRP